jgi:hypothetical protein
MDVSLLVSILYVVFYNKINFWFASSIGFFFCIISS